MARQDQNGVIAKMVSGHESRAFLRRASRFLSESLLAPGASYMPALAEDRQALATLS